MKKLCLIAFLGSVILTSCRKNPNAAFEKDLNYIEVNQKVDFTNYSSEAKSYSWDFGDGSTSTEAEPSHSWDTPGDYTVTLTAYSKKEKKEDTYSMPVRVYGYANKFTGTYSGIHQFTSWYCGSGSFTNNIGISGNTFGDTLQISNLDNNFNTFTATVSEEDSRVAYVLPQTGVYGFDGSQWDFDTIKVVVNAPDPSEDYRSITITTIAYDTAYSNTCGYRSILLTGER